MLPGGGCTRDEFVALMAEIKLKHRVNDVAFDKILRVLRDKVFPPGTDAPPSLHMIKKLLGVEDPHEFVVMFCTECGAEFQHILRNEWAGHRHDMCGGCGRGRRFIAHDRVLKPSQVRRARGVHLGRSLPMASNGCARPCLSSRPPSKAPADAHRPSASFAIPLHGLSLLTVVPLLWRGARHPTDVPGRRVGAAAGHGPRCAPLLLHVAGGRAPSEGHVRRPAGRGHLNLRALLRRRPDFQLRQLRRRRRRPPVRSCFVCCPRRRCRVGTRRGQSSMSLPPSLDRADAPTCRWGRR